MSHAPTITRLFLFVLVLTNLQCGGSDDGLLQRTKRFLIYPMGGLFKIVFGLATPVKLGLKQSMSAALNLQFQYAVTTNLSYIKAWPPVIVRSREKRDESELSDRSLAYMGIEALLDRYGINGRECILRSICENAWNSVYHKANGLYGQLTHIFLTPDYGDGEYDSDLDQAYIDAQKAGAFGVDCFSSYSKCAYGHGILDFVTTFEQ